MRRPAEIEAKIIDMQSRIPTEVIKDRGVNKARGKGWRFVHDGNKVVLPPFEANPWDETATKHTVFIGNSKQQCEAEIKRLQLGGMINDNRLLSG